MQCGGHFSKCTLRTGCQSREATTVEKQGIQALMMGMMASPSATGSAPPGQKSFCTSTTSRTVSRPNRSPLMRTALR
jgi:hypothetical protein